MLVALLCRPVLHCFDTTVSYSVLVCGVVHHVLHSNVAAVTLRNAVPCYGDNHSVILIGMYVAL